MNANPWIPAIDPIPLPAPYWLFKGLLLLTFTLHILAMNFMLGTTLIAVAARLRGKNEEFAQLYQQLRGKLPNLLPATITLGIAPLLFLQVLYGPFFYSASIVMAWPWFLVIIFLIIAYYGFYFISFKQNKTRFQETAILIFSTFLIVLIAFLYTNNMTLFNRPEHWATKYFSSPQGWNLHFEDSSLWPRYLHFITGAAAIGGLFVAFLGKNALKQNKPGGRLMLREGLRWFLFANMAQVFSGFWFLLALPRSQMLIFMGKNRIASLFLTLGLLLTFVIIFLAARELKKAVEQVSLKQIGVLTLLILVMMVVMRDALRDAFLAPYFQAQQMPAAPQWDVFSLFLILFLAGAALWILMLKRYPFSQNSK